MRSEYATGVLSNLNTQVLKVLSSVSGHGPETYSRSLGNSDGLSRYYC